MKILNICHLLNLFFLLFFDHLTLNYKITYSVIPFFKFIIFFISSPKTSLIDKVDISQITPSVCIKISSS